MPIVAAAEYFLIEKEGGTTCRHVSRRNANEAEAYPMSAA